MRSVLHRHTQYNWTNICTIDMCDTHWVASKTRDNRHSRSKKKEKKKFKKKGRQPYENLTRTLHIIQCCAHIDTLSIETTAVVPCWQ